MYFGVSGWGGLLDTGKGAGDWWVGWIFTLFSRYPQTCFHLTVMNVQLLSNGIPETKLGTWRDAKSGCRGTRLFLFQWGAVSEHRVFTASVLGWPASSFLTLFIRNQVRPSQGRPRNVQGEGKQKGHNWSAAGGALILHIITLTHIHIYFHLQAPYGPTVLHQIVLKTTSMLSCLW